MNDQALQSTRRGHTAAGRGMAALDEHFGYPEWRADVDLVVLAMASETRCVLGMLFGSFSHGVIELELSDAQVKACGFDAGNGLSFADLDGAWRRALGSNGGGR